MMTPCVIVVNDNVVAENVLCRDSTHAEQTFFGACERHVPDWDKVCQESRDDALDEGYVPFNLPV